MAIVIKGLDSLMRKLNSMGGNCMDALKMAVNRTTLSAQGDARENAPIDTGNLRQNVNVNYENSGTKVTGVVYDNVEYALYQEMGTSKMAAHPFLMPALKSNQDVFQKEAENALKNAIRKVAK